MDKKVKKVLQVFMEQFKQDSWLEVTPAHEKTIADYISKNNIDCDSSLDIANLFRNIFDEKFIISEILKQNKLEKVANQMLDYYNNIWLPNQANFLDTMEEYHDFSLKGLITLFYNHNTKILSFEETTMSYYSQYTNEVYCMGYDKNNYMKFILINGGNLNDLCRFISWSIAKNYGYENEYPFEDLFYSTLQENGSTQLKKALDCLSENKTFTKLYMVTVKSNIKEKKSDYKFSKIMKIAYFTKKEDAVTFESRLDYPSPTGNSPFYASSGVHTCFLNDVNSISNQLNITLEQQDMLIEKYNFKKYHKDDYLRYNKYR